MNRVISTNFSRLSTNRHRTFIRHIFRLIISHLTVQTRHRFVILGPIVIVDVTANSLARHDITLRARRVFRSIRTNQDQGPNLSNDHQDISLRSHLVSVITLSLPRRRRASRGQVTHLIIRLSQVSIRITNTSQGLLNQRG